MLRGLACLLFFQFLGEAITRLSNAPIPGPVIGMVLLFLVLQISRCELPIWLGKTSQQLIRGLAFLFLPACAGIFFLPPEYQDQWPAIIGAIVIGTPLSMAATAVLLRVMMSFRGKDNG